MPQLKPPPSIEVSSMTEEAVLLKLEKITKLLEETKNQTKQDFKGVNIIETRETINSESDEGMVFDPQPDFSDKSESEVYQNMARKTGTSGSLYSPKHRNFGSLGQSGAPMTPGGSHVNAHKSMLEKRSKKFSKKPASGGSCFIHFGHDNWNLVLHMLFGIRQSCISV